MVNKILKWRYELALIAVSGLLLFTGLDKIEVNIMEARNFTTAREMVQNKEYLLTTLNGEPRYQKPPLPTWLTAVSGKVFGFDSLYALRLPVVLITILMVLTFLYFSKRMGFSPRSSFNNALILITSFYIFWAGRDNQWDMYTHSFMLISIYFLLKILTLETFNLLNSLIAGIFMGFSILSNGPVSFYALLIPFLISYWIVYKPSLINKYKYLITTLIVGVATGLSWYIYIRFCDPESFSTIANKETTNWGNYEVKPFYYYWDFFLQSGLWAIPSLTALVYPYLKSRVSNLKAYRFGILWTFLSVILLSVIPEKKVRYLVPAIIPLALTTGFYIEYLMNCFHSRMVQREKIWVYFYFGVIALFGFAYPFVLTFILKHSIKEHMFHYIFSSILIYTCSFSILGGLMKVDFFKVFYSVIVFFVGGVLTLIPISEEFHHNPEYTSVRKIQSFENQYKADTYRLSDIAPEIVWDFGKSISLIQQKHNDINMQGIRKFILIVNLGDSTFIKTQFPLFKFEYLYRMVMFENIVE